MRDPAGRSRARRLVSGCGGAPTELARPPLPVLGCGPGQGVPESRSACTNCSPPLSVLQNRLDDAIRSLETELSVDQPDPLQHLTWLYTQEHRYRDIIDVVAKPAAAGVHNPLMFFRRTAALLALSLYPGGDLPRRCGTLWRHGRLPRPARQRQQLARIPLGTRGFHAHLRDCERSPPAQPAREPLPRRTIGPGDRVRVGVISPDLRRHAVTYFAHATPTPVHGLRSSCSVLHPSQPRRPDC